MEHRTSARNTKWKSHTGTVNTDYAREKAALVARAQALAAEIRDPRSSRDLADVLAGLRDISGKRHNDWRYTIRLLKGLIGEMEAIRAGRLAPFPVEAESELNPNRVAPPWAKRGTAAA